MMLATAACFAFSGIARADNWPRAAKLGAEIADFEQESPDLMDGI
jgi:hypothetical protein